MLHLKVCFSPLTTLQYNCFDAKFSVCLALSKLEFFNVFTLEVMDQRGIGSCPSALDGRLLSRRLNRGIQLLNSRPIKIHK